MGDDADDAAGATEATDATVRARSASLMSARLGLPTVAAIVAVVAAGSFAAGQSISPPPSSLPSQETPAPASPAAGTAESEDTPENVEPLPPGHPPTTGASRELPAGHPPIDSVDQTGAQGAMPAAPSEREAPVVWTAPARWKAVANANPMRLATYRVPRAAGDPEDAELSITQAGGSIEANAARWIGQFDSKGQETATRSARKVGPLDVFVVAARGTYSGAMGMGKESSPRVGWALLGAIVATDSTPCFFKLTGPEKTVLGARVEFDAMVGSLAPR